MERSGLCVKPAVSGTEGVKHSAESGLVALADYQVDPKRKVIPSPAGAGKAAEIYLRDISNEPLWKLNQKLSKEDETDAEVKAIKAEIPFLIAPKDPDLSECFYYEHLFQDSLAKSLFPDVEDPKKLELIPPSTAPGSAALVYLIQDTSTKPPEIRGAFKIQPSKADGLKEILMTTAAEKFIKDKGKGKIDVSTTLGLGELSNQNYFIIQTSAPGKDLDHVLEDYAYLAKSKDTQENRRKVSEAIAGSAKVFAELHRMSPGVKGSPDAEAAERKAVKDNCMFDVNAFRATLLKEGPGVKDPQLPGPIEQAVNDSYLTKEQAQNLKKRLRKEMEDYKQIVEKGKIPPSFYHGDAHGGNVFIDKNGKATLIDYANFIYSIRNRDSGGVGDAANDVGRLIGSLQVEALKHGKSVEESAELAKEFLDSYKKQRGIEKGSEADKNFNTAVEFYRGIFYSLQSKDTTGKKFKAAYPPGAGTDDKTKLDNELKKKLYEAWLKKVEA